MASSPERPDAAKGHGWIAGRHRLKNVGSASLAFRTNNAGIMGVSLNSRYIMAADVADIVKVAKIVGRCGWSPAQLFRRSSQRANLMRSPRGTRRSQVPRSEFL
jgi:hypothetical protein